MNVDGLDIDVGVEGVLVEEDCTTNLCDGSRGSYS